MLVKPDERSSCVKLREEWFHLDLVARPVLKEPSCLRTRSWVVGLGPFLDLAPDCVDSGMGFMRRRVLESQLNLSPLLPRTRYGEVLSALPPSGLRWAYRAERRIETPVELRRLIGRVQDRGDCWIDWYGGLVRHALFHSCFMRSGVANLTPASAVSPSILEQKLPLGHGVPVSFPYPDHSSYSGPLNPSPISAPTATPAISNALLLEVNQDRLVLGVRALRAKLHTAFVYPKEALEGQLGPQAGQPPPVRSPHPTATSPQPRTPS